MNKQKTIIVTGISGQCGSWLADKLIARGDKVIGCIRRSSRGMDLGNANHLVSHPNLSIEEIDITDAISMLNLTTKVKADYFANCAAQSHVHTSFTQPQYTAQATGIGVLNCLEAIRQSGIHTRFVTCSTSELYGGISSNKANEETPFFPKSPYASAKLYAHWITKNYRESYKMFASTVIMFNNESERRSETFVTRKITKAVAAIKAGNQNKLFLGNLNAKRDWGYSPDYMDAMIKVLEHNEPDDFVLATGETHSIREFCQEAFSYAGLGDYNQYVEIDPRFYRPNEVEVLIGDATKAQTILGWKPTTTFTELVHKMVDYDIAQIDPSK